MAYYDPLSIKNNIAIYECCFILYSKLFMNTCTKNHYGNCSNHPELYQDDEGNTYCLFHAPIELRKKYGTAGLFNASISARPHDDVNYSGYEFDNDMPMPLPYQDYKFILKDCIVYHPIKWINEQFGHWEFSETVFHENVDFSEAIFHREILLKKVTFKKHADFKGSSFISKNEFRIACNTLDFSETMFSSDSIFEIKKNENVKTSAQEKAKLIKMNFLHMIIEPRRKVTFLGDLVSCAFSPRGEGIIEFSSHARLENASFMDSNLKNCIFNSTELNKCFFLGADISETRFVDCSFNEEGYLLGGRRILLFDELFREKRNTYEDKEYVDWFNFVITRRTYIFNALKETYCAFKNNYENSKDYVTADKFHCSEMEMKQALLLERIRDRLSEKESREETCGRDRIALKSKIKQPVLFNSFSPITQSKSKPVEETSRCNNYKKIELYYSYVQYLLKNYIFSFYRWYQYLSCYGTSYIRPLFLILIALSFFSVSFMFFGLPDIQYGLGQQSDLLNVTKDFIEALFYATAMLIPGAMKYYLTESLSPMTKKISVIEFITMWTLIPLFILALKRHFKR